jgi:hypothetical protein
MSAPATATATPATSTAPAAHSALSTDSKDGSGPAPHNLDFEPVELSDVKVTVKGAVFRCHKNVLIRHCKVFRTMHEVDPKATEWALPHSFQWTAHELKFFLDALYTPVHVTSPHQPLRSGKR